MLAETIAHREPSDPASPSMATSDVPPTIRTMRETDLEAAARAAFAAHSTLAARRGHPSEHPTEAFSAGLLGFKLKDPNASGLVAERGGRILGSIFLNRFPPCEVAAIGPLTVDPSAEGTGAGRRLMEAALAEARSRGIGMVRLVQSPAHLRSFALYTKLGFTVREPLALMQPGSAKPASERTVRQAKDTDIERCEELCAFVLGFARSGEIRTAVSQGTATVAFNRNRITGYTTGLGLRGHAAGETTDDLQALIAAAMNIGGPGFFVPLRNTALVQLLLAKGYRALWSATLMSLGPYQDPVGAYLPSIAY